MRSTRRKKQWGGMNQAEVIQFLEDIDKLIIETIQNRVHDYDILSEESISEIERLPPFFARYRNDFDRVIKRILEMHFMKKEENFHIDRELVLTNGVGTNINIGNHENLSGRFYLTDLLQKDIEPVIHVRLNEINKKDMADIIFKEIGKDDLGHVILRLLSYHEIRADGDDEDYGDDDYMDENNNRSNRSNRKNSNHNSNRNNSNHNSTRSNRSNRSNNGAQGGRRKMYRSTRRKRYPRRSI